MKSFLDFLVLSSTFLIHIVFTPVYQDNNPLLLGNPSGARAEVEFSDNYLMEKKQYSESYNKSRLGPNWVAWHLDSSDIGESKRSNKFIADTELPDSWYKVTQKDYKYTQYGFDRGHLCPSADRTASAEDNQKTFLMSNMLPQAPDLNRITWEGLEEYERKLSLEGNELYIFAGGWGKGGTGNTGYFEEIPVNSGTSSPQAITVPQYCWKIILALPEGEDDLNRIAADTTVIAVWIPNRQGVNDAGPWNSYKCSVDYIEAQTGYDFFTQLPGEIEVTLEK